MFDEVERHLIAGVHCKACNRSMNSSTMDIELCNTCMEFVIEYNEDITTEIERVV